MTPTTTNKGGGVWGSTPPKTHQNEHLDFAETTEDGQALATMKARAARCGCTLHQLADDTYLLTRWNCSRALPCLRAVGDLLRAMGGRP
jgi:hypothetical protein